MLKSKILICDDSIQYLRMLQMVLGTMTGAEVFTEREAKNIYKRLIEQEYDLLIMDPCMMNMTCEKLIAEIKKEKDSNIYPSFVCLWIITLKISPIRPERIIFFPNLGI